MMTTSSGLRFLACLVLAVFYLPGCDSSPPQRNRARLVPNKGQGENADRRAEPVPVVFDLPALLGKSIDDVRATLGKPQDAKQVEPSELQMQVGVNEWNNTFTKDGQELLVTFDPKTRRVADFFLPGDSQSVLMQRGNLSEGNSAYHIEAVKAIRDGSKITGIKIIPAH